METGWNCAIGCPESQLRCGIDQHTGGKFDSNSEMPEGVLKRATEIGLVGQSSQHRGLLLDLARAGRIDAEILLVGETGVGKELYARYIHACSPRTSREFIGINCGAIPESLFENELFGHSAGAYTDAGPRSEGLIAAAEGGTLFLDEVDSLPLSAQVKLLRVLQEKEYRRLGDTRLRRADVRIISAMNCDPNEAIADRRLRQDLYYRLNVIPKTIPPLRERPDDIAVLTHEFIRRYWTQYRSANSRPESPFQFTANAEQLLRTYAWPGNVRQLQNVIRNLVCQHPGPLITGDSLSFLGAASNEGPTTTVDNSPAQNEELLTLSFYEAKKHVVDRFECIYLKEMLRRTRGNICQAAQIAGKHRRAFFELMRKHGIDADEFKGSETTPEIEALQRAKPK